MAKAALIMDMPESCAMCDSVEEQHPRMYCGVPGIGEDVTDYIACRPDLCPLRELPGKEHNDNEYDEYSDGYDAGWNACLEEIGGKRDAE